MDKLIGKILVDSGFITLGQLNEARRQQMVKSETKLGELLVERGVLTREQLEIALSLQTEKRKSQGSQNIYR
jgi:hypothetical protein